MKRTSSIASLLTIAAILATPAVGLAQEDAQQASAPDREDLPKNVQRLLDGKKVTLNTEAVGPIELQLEEEGLFKVRLTYKERKMVGQGTFLELEGKGGHNVLHVALYPEDEIARLEQQSQQEAVGAAQALTADQHPASEQQEVAAPKPIEMKITILDEALILCESPTILGRAIQIGGDTAKAVIGLMVLSADYMRHILVDKVWQEFLVDTLAKRVIRDTVAKQFFRDLIGKRIFGDVIWKTVIVEVLAKDVFRDAVGKKFFRDIIWKKGIKGPAKWFAREFFHTKKPCSPEDKVDATVEVIGGDDDSGAEDEGLPLPTPSRAAN